MHGSSAGNRARCTRAAGRRSSLQARRRSRRDSVVYAFLLGHVERPLPTRSHRYCATEALLPGAAGYLIRVRIQGRVRYIGPPQREVARRYSFRDGHFSSAAQVSAKHFPACRSTFPSRIATGPSWPRSEAVDIGGQLNNNFEGLNALNTRVKTFGADSCHQPGRKSCDSGCVSFYSPLHSPSRDAMAALEVLPAYMLTRSIALGSCFSQLFSRHAG